MTYRIEFRPSAKKAFTSLPRDILKRVDAKILSLADNPRPRDTKKLKDEDLYRVKVGVYRVVYQIKDDLLLVLVVRIGHRREVYRRL